MAGRRHAGRIAQIVAAGILAAGTTSAQDYQIDWYTVDGGGTMNSTGGTFDLSGTIGQPDAGVPSVLIGGEFELTGGFWPVVLSCDCPGDLTGDGRKDGRDIELFVVCALTGSSCRCADINGVSGIDPDDAVSFVDDLLSATPCP